MQLGMIGLGRMGNGMTDRLRERDHDVRTYDPAVESRTATSLEELKSQLDAPRAFWMMIPAGKITEDTFQQLLKLADKGDTIVDGGNSNFRDSQRRHREAGEHGLHFVDAGISGGIWGLEDGFCRWSAATTSRCSGSSRSSRRSRPRTATRTSAHRAPGHFTKMVHNGIEYGLMQAYAEGFEVIEHSEFDVDLHELAGIWRYGSVVRSWLLDLLHSALRDARQQAQRHRAVRRGLGRGPLDDRGGDQRARVRAGDVRRPLRALRVARRGELRGQGHRRAAQRVRRPRDQGGVMAATEDKQQENPLEEGLLLRRTPDPCALVIFGASGDLTHKKLMPAIYALMVRRLLPPRFAIVGVARTDADDDEFRNDMKEAVQKHARDEFRQDVWDELAQNMHYVATDFADESGEDNLGGPARRSSTRSASSAATASTTSPFRRRRSRRSSRRSASGAPPVAGRG